MEVLKLSPLAKIMSPRRKRLSRARLLDIPAAIEKLEDRTLLAGNVVVSLAASGLLTVRGDQSANNIAITQTASGLQVASTDSGATEINGGAGPFTASSTVKSISIALKGGDNTSAGRRSLRQPARSDRQSRHQRDLRQQHDYHRQCPDWQGPVDHGRTRQQHHRDRRNQHDFRREPPDRRRFGIGLSRDQSHRLGRFRQRHRLGRQRLGRWEAVDRSRLGGRRRVADVVRRRHHLEKPRGECRIRPGQRAHRRLHRRRQRHDRHAAGGRHDRNVFRHV